MSEPHYGPMTEQRAREILAHAITQAGGLWSQHGMKNDLVVWEVGTGGVNLDGEFSADELEAIAWWMRNKGKYPSAGEG